MNEEKLLDVACAIANDWRRHRDVARHRMPESMVIRLNQLEALTRGDARRCTCGIPSEHRMGCPARPITNGSRSE